MIALALAAFAVAALGVQGSRGGDAQPPDEQGARVGLSAQGRAIRAFVASGSAPGPVVLVVGSIHGSEPAGVEVVQTIDGRTPSRGELAVVPSLNPDGVALDSRTNAQGVDLNRNFGSGWRPIGDPGGPEYSGPRSFSEPETRLARRVIRDVQPDVTIWFHQQVDPPLVRAWGPSVPAAKVYARLAGSRFDRLQWLPGSAPNWQNHRFPGTSSFVVELPWGDIGRATAARHASALLELGGALSRGAA